MTDAGKRFSLRDLPIPAKLVLTCFLLAVGGGYTAAMVQLHMQDARSGEAMPTVADVILKYTGKKWIEDASERPEPVSTFVKLITAPEDGTFGGTGTMSPAFTRMDGEGRRGRTPEESLERLRPERLGERDALVLWAKSPAKEREEAYQNDRFAIDPARLPKGMTPRFKNPDGAIKVKSIIDARCARCHKPGGDDAKATAFPLDSFAHVEKYLAVPEAGAAGSGSGWVRVCEPISIDKLTQSTHAHLLSFAVLFALTGLVFAFTSYPTTLRCLIGPWVLVAVVADVSLWWLARLSEEWGPNFAMGIIGTGAAAGVGLFLQITLSLLNMYGWRGEFAILAIFALAGFGGWQLYSHQVKPGLEAQQKKLAATANKNPEALKPQENEHSDKPPVVPKNGNGTSGGAVAKMLTIAAGEDVLKKPWKKGVEGGMARAFFDKDSAEFAAALKEKDPETQQKLTPERHGEREALLAWLKLPDAERKKCFDADAFPIPSDWAKKPITGSYQKDGKLLVKSIIADRCMRCHDGADEDKAPFSDYESLSKYLK